VVWTSGPTPGEAEVFGRLPSLSDGPLGDGPGMQVWAEVDEDDQGREVVRFPFSIPGF